MYTASSPSDLINGLVEYGRASIHDASHGLNCMTIDLMHSRVKYVHVHVDRNTCRMPGNRSKNCMWFIN